MDIQSSTQQFFECFAVYIILEDKHIASDGQIPS